MCGEDGRAARPEQPAIELRRTCPLHVDHVGAREREARHADRMLERLDSQPHARRAHARGERIEPLAGLVALRRRDGSEPEARRHELDVHSGACERGRQRTIVGRRVRGRIGDDDAHWTGTLEPLSSESRA